LEKHDIYVGDRLKTNCSHTKLIFEGRQGVTPIILKKFTSELEYQGYQWVGKFLFSQESNPHLVPFIFSLKHSKEISADGDDGNGKAKKRKGREDLNRGFINHE